jgi:hypothetical protein
MTSALLWDETEGVLVIGDYPDPTFEAVCLSTDAVEDWVYVRNNYTGSKLTVAKADPSDSSKVPAIGVIISKSDSTNCIVQWMEKVNIYTGLTAGRVYFLNTNGRHTLTPPHGGIKYVQKLGVAVDETTLLISLQLDLTKKVP